jgi:hypothetical protein
MNAVAAPESNKAATAAWVCLAIAWVTFLVPIPGIGLFVGWPLNLVAFILAIVAMSKRGTMAGLFQLLASLLVSPVVYFVGIVILAGSMAAASDDASVSMSAAEEAARVEDVATKTALPVDAAALWAAYDANEVAADQQYKGQALAVSGTVKSFDSSMGDEPVVMLEAGDFDAVHVRDLPAATAAGLAKGQRITVQCTGDGEVMGSPMLGDCNLL